MEFFDAFPRFYETSKTGPWPNRLNGRYRALIQSNQQIIAGASILDLASHDGRWSFAALKNGAKKVVGIEGRRELVQHSMDTMELYGIPRSRYRFICGDVFEEIGAFGEDEFDLVLCFGFFYHIMNHMLLLENVKRLRPQYLLIDTGISADTRSVIELREEDVSAEANAISARGLGSGQALVGYPTKVALEAMLRHCGFELSYYDWLRAGITNWEHLEDYRDNTRVSLLAKCSVKSD
jgi:hypothetical protein